MAGHNKCWQGYGELGTFVRCWRERKLVPLLWKTVWRFPKTLNIELPYGAAILPLGAHPKGMTVYIHTFRQMFISASSLLAPKWKQPQMSTGKWMGKQNVVLPCNVIPFCHKKEWNSNICYNMKDLKNIRLRERSHSQKIARSCDPTCRRCPE